MARSQVDLEDLTTDEPAAEAKPKRSSSRGSSRSSSRTSKRGEADLQARLAGCFERIAAALSERGDDELAEIVAEDGPIMSQGLVSLTRPFTALRLPLLAVVAIIEPLLAFGRIFRVVAIRFANRRAMRAWEAEQAAQAQEEAAT